MPTLFALLNKNIRNYYGSHIIISKCILFLSIIFIFSVIFTRYTDSELDWFILPEGKNKNTFFKNMIHFSFTTFSTTGYGDIVPTTDRSRRLTHLMIFLAFIVAII